MYENTGGNVCYIMVVLGKTVKFLGTYFILWYFFVLLKIILYEREKKIVCKLCVILFYCYEV